MTDVKRRPISPEFRVSFPVLDQADDNKKYRLVMLFPKGTEATPATTEAQKLYQAMKKEAIAAATEKWGEDQKRWPAKIEWPFKDQGNSLDRNGSLRDGYEAGAICVSASSKRKPQIIDAAKRNLEAADLYLGCFARASYHAYAWEFKNEKGAIMKRGVSIGLDNIQKTREGEPFTRRTTADEDFEAFDTGDGNDPMGDDAVTEASGIEGLL